MGRVGPGFNLEHVRSPLLISCLEKGTLVGSWDIYGGLRTLGKPVDLVWLRKEDAPHVLVQPHHRYLSQQEAVDWFDFWLNGHEDSDSAKMAKYARWRKLRDLEIRTRTPARNHRPDDTGTVRRDKQQRERRKKTSPTQNHYKAAPQATRSNASLGPKGGVEPAAWFRAASRAFSPGCTRFA